MPRLTLARAVGRAPPTTTTRIKLPGRRHTVLNEGRGNTLLFYFIFFKVNTNTDLNVTSFTFKL